MNLPPWAKVAIQLAWAALAAVLTSVGVPAVFIAAIAALLKHLGLLGSEAVPHEELVARAEAFHQHLADHEASKLRSKIGEPADLVGA